MKIAVIPARGGSKRIKNKNIKPFAGKPIIEWSIKAARDAGLFDKIIVSTDSAEIADLAVKLGADVPFKRPRELADDYTPTSPVIAHAIKHFIDQDFEVDLACCIYPAAPFIQPSDLKTGLRLLQSSGASFSFPVTCFPHPIQRALKVNVDGKIGMVDPTQFEVRSQDLIETYYDAGQFYWGKIDSWLSNKPIFSSDAMPIIIPAYRCQDIDTHDDWVEAELKFKFLNRQQSDFFNC